MHRTVALVTGATGGIGLEFARLLAKEGYDLVLVARDARRLDDLAAQFAQEFQIATHPIVADLSVSGAASQLAVELEQRGLRVAILINNAGYATYGPFIEADLDNEMRMIQLNVTTLTELTGRLLPPMLAAKEGRILNVASTAAFFPGPLMAVYYATKAFVLSFSQALANELEGTGVCVSVLCPGATATGFSARAHMEDSKLFKGRTLPTAASVARVGWRGLMRGERVIIPSWHSRIQIRVAGLLPRDWLAGAVRRAQAR